MTGFDETGYALASRLEYGWKMPSATRLASCLLAILPAGLISNSGTVAASELQIWERNPSTELESTRGFGGGWARIAVTAPISSQIETSIAVMEIRRHTGFTWAQLADLFDVSRRTIHFWASGRRLNAENERDVFSVRDLLRRYVGHRPSALREALFVASGVATVYDLMRTRRFGMAQIRLSLLLAEANARPDSPLPNKSPFLAASPVDLLDALNDQVHVAKGQGRVAATKRIRLVQ